MTVRELKERMSGGELKQWFQYFKQRPMGYKEDLRSFYQLSAWSSKKLQPGDLFPSLSIIHEQQMKDEEFRVRRAANHPFIQKMKQIASQRGEIILGGS